MTLVWKCDWCNATVEANRPYQSPPSSWKTASGFGDYCDSECLALALELEDQINTDREERLAKYERENT